MGSGYFQEYQIKNFALRATVSSRIPGIGGCFNKIFGPERRRGGESWVRFVRWRFGFDAFGCALWRASGRPMPGGAVFPPPLSRTFLVSWFVR